MAPAAPSVDWPTQVRRALQALADPQRAPAMQAYMRGQFVFCGIPTPVRRQAVAALVRPRQTASELLAHARALWAMPERECQYVAVDLLARQHRALGMADIPAIIDLVQAKSWWDSVDGLAGVVGDVVLAARLADPAAQQAMDAALRHDNLWVRRIALLHQLGWRGATDCERLFGYALAQAGEADFFIRKAIGWALRDFARTEPQAVVDFLNGAGRGLSALSRREAGKHLSGVL
ncbi:DNA alkylation repair protein [Dechloromonas sp. XY25]|uniref:DNA alkylation repair protein n=1 Tax=Dechloromonas hankyongensis TaxID=2908002 RepID=A0ABS9K5C4_9RHOO|nr:DNA alkylation repair protein [Dechloromonas hankyongensis]MCG2578285.1 DNA alkylation repair protein [Dechloromonas hankyongensis]